MTRSFISSMMKVANVVAKSFVCLLLAALGLCATGCDDDNGGGDSVKASIVGQWELTGVQLATKSAQVGDETVTVYVEFDSDGTFALAQIIGAGRYQTFTGTWSLSGDILSGRYDGGVSWGSDYQVSISENTLTMTVYPDNSDVYTYRRCTIPDGVF